MERLVIYKDLNGWNTTTEENHGARIRNERKVTHWTGFDTPQEIINYCVKWYGSKESDFVIYE